VKLRDVELGQVRKFTGVVAVKSLADGVNLVIGANEDGKSTLLAGLRAALFARHTSRAAEVRGLRHHRNETAPRVALELEDAEGRWRLEKRFLQSAYARLVSPHGVTMEGDAAEAALHRRLGRETEAVTGLWNLLLVGQGEALEAAVPRDARATLQASLEAALGSAEAGTSAGALIVRLDERLKELVHGGHGAPIRRWRSVRDELQEVTTAIEDLRGRLDDNAADLDALETALRARGALVRGFDEDAAEAAVAGLNQQLSRQVAHGRAEAALGDAERALERRRALATALAESEARAAVSNAAAGQAAEALQTLEAEGRTARATYEQATADLAAAEERLVALRDLERLVDERDRLNVSLDAEASELALDLTPSGLAELRLDGERPPAGRVRIRLTKPVTVELAGYGRLQVRPAADRIERIRAGLAKVEAEIEDSVRAVWPDRAPGRLHRAGLGERHETLARVRLAADDAAEAARQRLADAKAAWQGENARLEERRAAARSSADAQVCIAEELRAARASMPDAALEQTVADRRAAVAAAGAGRSADESQPSAPGLREGLAAHRAQRHALEREIERRRASVDVRAADGLRERLIALEEKQERLRLEDTRFTREVEVLRLLRETLIDAEKAVRDRYLEPLLACLRPYLELLLPGLKVEVDERLQVVAVRRDGVEEPFAQLSHGTREQIAVAVRLAFAEVLIDDGHPCFVVLDDALVFSDDDRLERMFRALERAGQKVQILVLTCRERAFAGLRAKRLAIEHVVAEPAPFAQPVAASRLA
jgi:DNA repair exonuclease SbcCD ATPase subunit